MGWQQLLRTSAQLAQGRGSLHPNLLKHKGGVQLFQFVLVWPLNTVHTGILTHLHRRHSRWSRSAVPRHTGAGQGSARSPQQTPKPKPRAPALPAFLFTQVLPSKGSYWEPSRHFSYAILDSELCKSRITPGTQTAAYQPRISSPLCDQLSKPACLCLTSHPPLFPSVFPCPSSPATPLHNPRTRRMSHRPRSGLRDILPELPPASHLLCRRLHHSKSPPQNTISTRFQQRVTIQTVSPFCLSQQNICL